MARLRWTLKAQQDLQSIEDFIAADSAPPLGMWTTFYWEHSAEDAVRRLAGLGWRHIDLACEHLAEIASGGPARIDAFAGLLKDLGVVAWQAHAMLDLNVALYDEDLPVLLRQIGECGRLGIRHIVAHPGAGPKSGEMSHGEVLCRSIRAFGVAAKAAESAGVKIAIENMGRAEFGGRIADLLDLIEGVGSPAMAICFDSGHANAVGLDVPGAIRQCGPLLGCLHLHDNDGTSDQHRMPGGGNLDWSAVAQSLWDVQYAGPWCLEIPGENKCPIPLRDLKLQAIRRTFECLTSRSPAPPAYPVRSESVSEFCRRGLVRPPSA